MDIDKTTVVVTKISEFLVTALMYAILILVSAESFARYLFSYSFIYVNDLSITFLTWIGFIGSSLAIKEGGHAAFELFQGKLARIVRINRLWIIIVCNLLIAVFVTFLLITGIAVSLSKIGEFLPATELDQFWLYVSAPVGSALMLFQLIMLIRTSLLNISSKAETEFVDGRARDLRDIY